MRKLSLVGATLLAAASCSGPPREPLLTSYNADHGLSVRYPASWRTEQAAQDGIWYRYFLGPPTGPNRKPAVSVTLLAGPLGSSLEEYAEAYLAGNKVVSSREEARQGVRGRAYLFSSPDGATRYSLLLFKQDDQVYGLYAQGEPPLFEQHFATLEEIFRSLSFERPELYDEQRNDKFGFSLRTPPSWQVKHSFSGSDNLLLQLASPALGADASRQTAHASLTLTVEPASGDGSLEAYYRQARHRLGESFSIRSHKPWRDGYVDWMHSETSVSASREKRFYWARGGRGYCLSCAARDDVFHRVSRWCDMIAATFEIHPEGAE